MVRISFMSIAHIRLLAVGIGLSVTLGILISLPNTLLAQSTDGLGARVQPTLIEERVDPGASVSGTITVTNTSAIEQMFELATRNVTAVDAAGRPTFSREEDDITGTLASWITTDQSLVTLSPGQSTTVGYTVSIPEDAAPGAHFGGVFIDRQADRVESSGAGVGYMVGVLMSMQVAGEIREGLRIREFSSNRAISMKPDGDFTVVVENEGNIYDEVQGILTISDMFGNTIDTVEINSFRIVPGFERQIDIAWETDGFHIGRYTALLSLVHGQTSRKTETREVTFWIIPVDSLGIVLGGAIAFLLVVFIFVRMYIRKQLAQAGVSSKASVRVRSGFMQKLSTLLIVLLTLAGIALACVVLFFS